MLLREVKLALFLEARAGVVLTQALDGRPILGELRRDTALGRVDGLREMLGLLVLRAGRRRGGQWVYSVGQFLFLQEQIKDIIYRDTGASTRQAPPRAATHLHITFSNFLAHLDRTEVGRHVLHRNLPRPLGSMRVCPHQLLYRRLHRKRPPELRQTVRIQPARLEPVRHPQQLLIVVHGKGGACRRHEGWDSFYDDKWILFRVRKKLNEQVR